VPSDHLLLKTLTSVISTTNIVAMGAQEKGMGDSRTASGTGELTDPSTGSANEAYKP
jgi:hypothetical protein